MSKMYPEFPGNSTQKRRNPQTRDYVAAMLKSKGMGLGSGVSYQRSKYVIKRADELKAANHASEAQLLCDALDVSIRGAYEIAKLADDALLALCQMVTNGDARDLIVARRYVREMARNGLFEGMPRAERVTLGRCKSGMYRITSLHNHSSVLMSAQDLIALSSLIESISPELQE